MTEKEIMEKLRQAYSHGTPEVLDAVLSDCKEQKGQVMMMTVTKNRKPWAAKLAGIAAALCLVAGGAAGFRSYQVNHRVDATVSLDVNPSVEIQVNRKERVLGVTPLNADGEVIVGEMDFSGSDLEVAVNAIIGSMLQKGYLSELANSILISVDNPDSTRGAALQERLTAEVDKLLKTDTFSGAVLSQTVEKNDDLKQLARKNGVTVGKAQLIQAVLDKNGNHTFEELAELSINELNLLLRGGQGDTRMETVGTASDKAYIGEARAREIALKKAGVSAGSLTAYEIELDFDDGAMIYDVEFTSGSSEYDCEIDALTGSVVKFETETKAVSVGEPAAVTEARAKEIALAHAGVSAKSASGYKCELDTDDGTAVYEIEFLAGGYEYDYEIDAGTGAVRKAEKEAGDASSQSGTAAITEARAKEIALAHAGVSAKSAAGYKCELDTDDGTAVYEIEFLAGGYEYDYEIDAGTGAVRKAEKELDD